MKIIKWVFLVLLLLTVIGAAYFFMKNEDRPASVPGPEADALAMKMMEAVNKPAWDSTRYLTWTFKGMHSFLWDKERNWAEISFDDQRVLLKMNDVAGKAFKGTTLLEGDESAKSVAKAWEYWCNDSFWFNAVVKAFDPGTKRGIVKMDDGSKALMVSYDSGGVTPGDSYLWILDDNGLPTSYKMWVKIIPMGGMEFTWEDWKTISTGAKISALHKSSVLDLDITNIKGGMTLSDVGVSKDPFKLLEN